MGWGAAALVAAACASRPGAAPAAPNPEPPTLQSPPAAMFVRLGPSALRYVVHQRVHIAQEFQGQTQSFDLGFRLFFRATIVGPADSSGYPLTLTIDSVLPDSGSFLPPTATADLVVVRGFSYTGRLTAAGRLTSLVPRDTAVAQRVTQLVGSFRSFYPRLPAGGAQLGAAWTDTVTVSERDVKTVAVTQSRATAWEERLGARCLRIEVGATFQISGAGEQGGQHFDLAGTGVSSAVEFVALDGRFLGGESHDSSAVTIMLPTQGLAIPRRQVSQSTVTVLP